MMQKTFDLNTLSALKIQFIWLICKAREQYNTYSGYICITSIQSINRQAPLANSLALLISPFSQLKISGAKDICSAMNARPSLSILQNFSLKKLFNVQLWISAPSGHLLALYNLVQNICSKKILKNSLNGYFGHLKWYTCGYQTFSRCLFTYTQPENMSIRIVSYFQKTEEVS